MEYAYTVPLANVAKPGKWRAMGDEPKAWGGIITL